MKEARRRLQALEAPHPHRRDHESLLKSALRSSGQNAFAVPGGSLGRTNSQPLKTFQLQSRQWQQSRQWRQSSQPSLPHLIAFSVPVID